MIENYEKVDDNTLRKVIESSISKSDLLSRKAGLQKDIETHIGEITRLTALVKEADNLLSLLEAKE